MCRAPGLDSADLLAQMVARLSKANIQVYEHQT